LTYYGLLRIPENPEEQLCRTRDVGFERSSWFNFYRMIRNFISPFCATAPETALQYAYLVALNGDLPDLDAQQKQLALDLVRDIVLASRQWSKLLGTIRSDGVKQVRLF
jgi:nuclear pore complex protein Nup93